MLREEYFRLQPHFFTHELTKAMTKIVALGDSHYLNPEIQNRPQKMINHEPMLNFLEDKGPWDVVILGGDMWDLDFLGHWNSNKFGDIGHNRIEEYVHQEAEDMHNFIKHIIQKTGAKTIYYLEGNHEIWLWQYQEKHQKFNKQTLDQWLRLDELGVQFLPVHSVLKIGKYMTVRHGECYRTENPAKQSIVKSHRSVFMFHHHKFMSWPGYSDADSAEKIQAYCIPGMCNVCAMEFMKNSPNNWSNGFMTASMKVSGKFTPYIHSISPKGRFLYEGKEYR